MRIGMVLDKPFPPDIRVDKEAKALTAAGFAVGLLAEGEDGAHTYDKLDYGLSVYRTATPPSSRWQRDMQSLTLWQQHLLKSLREFVADFKPSVLHVHDFPFVKTVLSVADAFALPVVADLHENMPAAVRVWRRHIHPLRRLKDAVVRNYYLWRWQEKKLLSRCARIIVVVPEAAERLYGYGLGKDKIIVVSNTEDKSTFCLSQPDPVILEQYQDKWVVSYVGVVGPHRGVDTAIRAVPLAVKHIHNLCLAIVGVRDKRQLDFLSRMIRQAGAERHVKVIGWQPFEKVNSYIAASAACLVPHNASEHTHTTVPHKLFQYMIAGKPVVVSDVRPLKRIVEEIHSGLVFTAGDPVNLAEALVKLYHHPDLAARMGNNGRRGALGPYSWRHDAQRLIELYRGLERSIQRN